MTNLCTKFHLKISMHDRDNEAETESGMTEGQKDGMTERGNTICPGHFMVVA